MYQSERLDSSILRAEINWYIGMAFIGSFGLAMALIIWQAAFNENPVANALYQMTQQETQLQ